jgi:putative ubiquitin-RnfH superfamily antitoxin RatB of RatAB toxin-antitoxin module
MMKVEVVMAWPRRHEAVALELPENATLAQAIEKAGLAGSMDVTGYAIFGVNAEVTTPLRDGDRVELLRALQIDPKDARRRRASKPKR